MGSGGSLPNNFKSQEPPPLPPPFYTGNPHYGLSRLSGSSCDDGRTIGSSTVTLETPRIQETRSLESVKNEEWWQQRAAAPSLTSLRPQQETLLTYAAQMTGWQSGNGNAVPSMQQEAMELARTVSHLAAANQQLASAHTSLLAQLESLYLELNRERQLRIESYRGDNEDREKLKLAQRVDNLEAAIAEKSSSYAARESSWRERDRQLRASVEELESRLASRNNVEVGNDDSEELELRLGASSLAEESKIGSRFGKNRHFELNQNSRRISTDNKRRSPRREESQEDCEKSRQADLSLEYQKAIHRIHMLENELENSCMRNVLRGCAQPCIAEKDRQNVAEDETPDRSPSRDSKSSENEEEIRGLLEEIETLKDERLEYREINEKLTTDLENQRLSIEKLRRDYDISRSQYDKVEYSLMERKKQLVALTKDFDIAKSETTRLLKELQTFHLEKDTATARIADLEKNLAKTTLANEQIGKSEVQESSRLRKKLSEEVTSRREQTKALEDALKEIQRLNKIIEVGGKNKEASDREEITQIEATAEEEVLDTEISVPRSSNMEEFRKELNLKREARQRAIAAVSSEMDRLRRELDAEKEAHSETSRVLDLLKLAQANNVVTSEVIASPVESARVTEGAVEEDWCVNLKTDSEQNTNEADAQALTDILKVSDELRSSIRLQTEKIDDLRYHLECEPEGHRNRIENLKELAEASREASGNRERQINKLKNLLAQIIAHLGDPRFRVEITDDVRAEHDRQIEDIRRLRSLYDERLRVLVDLRDITFKELTDVKDKLKGSRKENGGLEEDLRKAEEKIDTQDTEISNLESQLGLTKADCRDLQNQMSVINSLFTQMLLSASSADMDLDRLTRLLQENHDLISDMAREEGTEAAALPKLLLDLVEQVEGRGRNKSAEGEVEKKDDIPKEENIANNLPKVWRVLLELLSCHTVESPAVVPASLSTDPNSCYKSVDTPSGPRLVISVSKTYIRLKELILEKKHLEKEMNRMKQLNTHLESKLGEQEKRLSTVSSELSKTWNVVGRMQAQHQQLHTHEKILRYELQQKRKMLQELKQELEYCREKWESARQKNTNTEIEWRSLRREFAARKSLAAQDSFNNSGESGFSDERGDDSDEEDEAVEERVRIGPRRRARKENPRAPTPDTESEQPTDTEQSESKTESTTPEQRTPTPETAVPIEESSSASTSADSAEMSSDSGRESRRSKPMNPLDEALANVIQNLITSDESNAARTIMPIAEIQEDDGGLPPDTLVISETEEALDFIERAEGVDVHECVEIEDTDEKSQEDEAAETQSSKAQWSNGEIVPAVSVFSIGPFPACPQVPTVKSVQFSDPLIVGPSAQPSISPPSEDVRETEENTLSPTDESVNDASAKDSCLNVENEEEDVKDIEPEAEASKTYQETAERSEDSNGTKTLPDETDLPSTSTADTSTRPARTHEEVLAARAARLKRLEEQADWLMKKMNATSKRGSALSNRLEELHEAYGEAPVPPPMPDVLPSVRIPSETDNQRRKEKSPKEDLDRTPPPDAP